MVASRHLRSTLLLLPLAIFLASGCSKSGVSTPKSTTPNGVDQVKVPGGCDSLTVNSLLAEITKSEVERDQLEKIAKGKPEKANFRKLYEGELAFANNTDDKLLRLAQCKTSPDTLADLKKKIATSRANATYLVESFPDFK